jgi:hypothetical protein
MKLLVGSLVFDAVADVLDSRTAARGRRLKAA